MSPGGPLVNNLPIAALATLPYRSLRFSVLQRTRLLTGFDRDIAFQAAKAFWKSLGRDGSSLTCLRFGQNGVYYDPIDDLVLRVHRPSRTYGQVLSEISIAKHIKKNGCTATHPTAGIGDAPYIFDGLVYTVWDFAKEDNRPKDLFELAQLFRAFHKATENFDGRAQELAWGTLAIGRFDRFLAEGRHSGPDVIALRSRVIELEERLSGDLPTSLGKGFLHGDAHVGNVISTQKGLVLTDFERVSYGILEWDAVPMIVAIRRFGNSGAELRTFIDGYKASVLDHPLIDEMCELREIFMSSSLMMHSGSSPEIDRSINHQMRTLLACDRFAQWTPHW